MSEKIIKKNGNDYLLDLFKTEKELLDLTIKSIYFVDNKTFIDEFEKIRQKIENSETNIIRYTKKNVEYIEKYDNGKYSRKLSNLERIKRLSDNDKLYIRDNKTPIKVKFDSTGNYELQKKFKHIFNIDLVNEYKNYTIAHLNPNPNRPYKHSLINVVLVPTFLNKFLDNGGLNLKCGINVLNIVKSLVLLKFKEIPLDKIKEKYSLNDSEINYLKNFTVSKLNILKTDK